MKRIFLAFFLVLASNLSYAQIIKNEKSSSMEEFIRKSEEKRLRRLTPGQHLQKAANCFYAATGFSVLAVVPLVVPGFEESTVNIPDAKGKNTKVIVRNRDMNYVVGAVLGVGGIISYVCGISHIKRAGKRLEITASQNSIGMVFKF